MLILARIKKVRVLHLKGGKDKKTYELEPLGKVVPK